MKQIKTKKNSVIQAKTGPKFALNGKVSLEMFLDLRISMNLKCAAVMKHQQINPAKAVMFINQLNTVPPEFDIFNNDSNPKMEVNKTPTYGTPTLLTRAKIFGAVEPAIEYKILDPI